MILVYQICTVVLLLLLSGFFAGAETGIYRLSRFRLRLGIQEHRPFFSILDKVVKDSYGMVLTTLIGNNLTNYASTSIVTYIILSRTQAEHSAEFYATAVMTPLLFLCAEIIPKSMFYLHADTILPRLAPLLWFFWQLFTRLGIVGLLKSISGFLSRLFGLPSDAAEVITAGHRTQMKQIINETRDEGIVSAFQKDIMHRTVDIPAMPVREVMIPISKVVTADVQTDAAGLRDILRSSPYTRLPVYSKTKNNIVGLINIYDVLTAHEQFDNLEQFVKPAGCLPATTSVLDAIGIMRKGNHRIMLVTPSADRRPKPEPKPSGLITMKDLIEELTGELTPW